MAKKASEEQKEKAEGKESNYRLRSDAVDDLVQSHTGRTKAYSEKELRRYRTRKGITMPEWVKVLLLKIWFAGVVCYFIIWGLGLYMSAALDLVVVSGIALGLVNDLLLNNLLHFMEETPGQNDKWMMFPSKNVVSLGLNILYSLVVMFCVYTTYTTVNAGIAAAAGAADEVALGVEPISFGLLYMAFDMAFVGIKRGLLRVFHDARDRVDREAGK